MHKTNSFKSKRTQEYYGSNDELKDDVKKYGKHNFIREWLFIFNNEKDMLDKEHELVNEDFWKSDMTYNETRGGGNPPNHKGKRLTENHKQKLKENNARYWLGKTRKPFTKNHKRNMSIASNGKRKTSIHRKNISNGRKGMKFTKQHRQNLSTSHKNNFPSKETIEKISKSLEGENNPNVKLTKELAYHIKYNDSRLYKRGSVAQMSNEYNISKSSIFDIKHKRTWKNI